MSEKRFTMIGAVVARFTRLDGCGRPLWGDKARLVTEGIITTAASANTDETDAVEVRNSNGKLIASRPARSKTTGHTAVITLGEVDPELVNFLTLNPTVENGMGEVAGFDLDTDVDVSQGGVAMELWSELSVDDPCAPGQGVRYGYSLLPFLQGGTLGDLEWGNDAISLVINNASSIKGHGWGQGPYLVDLDNTGTPVQLDTVKSSVTLRQLEVGMEPPEPTDGAIPLDDPSAPAATAAVAGTPGHFNPAGAFRPETLAALIAAGGSIVASPTTAWSAGQSVELQDGSTAHWTGTAWAEGQA